MGKSVSRHLATNTHVVKLFPRGSKARFNIAKTLAICKLGEGQGKKLIPTGKTLNLVVTAVAVNAKAKLVARNEVQ
jgi:hypothetical protein